MPLALATRYARALAELALDPSAGMDPQAVVSELRTFEEVLGGTSELRHVLLSPAVSPARKRAVIDRLAGPLGTSRLVRNFLRVVINHRRISLLSEIAEALQSQIDERMGVVGAGIASARELTQDQKAGIASQLAILTRKKVRCVFSDEESLIGGAKVKIGSTSYDGSVRGQLALLRRKLME